MIRITITLALALLISIACGPEAPDVDSTSTGSATTTSSTSTTTDASSSSSGSTSTGDETSTSTGDEPEWDCTHLVGDPAAVVCERCEGALCCWAPPGAPCLEPCEQAGPLACDKGFSCHKAAAEDPVGVCWPDLGDVDFEGCYPLTDAPLSLACKRCDLLGDDTCCWVAHDEPDACLEFCVEGECAEGFKCRSANAGGSIDVCWPE